MTVKGLVFADAPHVQPFSPGVVTLIDSSRAKNHGTMTNITWEQLTSRMWVPVYNGATSRISIPANGAGVDLVMKANEDFSISLWFRCQKNAFVSSETLFSHGAEATFMTGTRLVIASATTLNLTFNDNQGLARLSVDGTIPTPYTTGFHAVDITFDRNSLARCYYDGIFNCSLNISTRPQAITRSYLIGIYSSLLNGLTGNIVLHHVRQGLLTPDGIRSNFEKTRRYFGK
jgi:hypothetical protein